jgi:gliding motility-associated-like protein
VWTLLGVDYQIDNFSTAFDNEGMFTLSVVHYSNGCVSNQQQTVITVDNCPQELIFIPNTFTPDGNEHNQYFQPVITSGVDIYRFNFKIYNRWGEIVWESYDPTSSWDGTYNNLKCPDGSYNWVLQFGVTNTDEVKVYYGNLSIIR